MSHFVKTTRCPKCAEIGNDRKGDNLAIYSDGHKWCYSCGYYEGIDTIKSFLKQNKTHLPKSRVYLPEDCDFKYPLHALAWVKQYELTEIDLKNHHVMYSESKQSLFFPVFQDGDLLLYSTRYFGTNKKHPKTIIMGKTSNTLNIIGNGNTLVLTEDVVSAIKVSKFTAAMPLYGCNIQKRTVAMLQHLSYNKILLWLDPDKRAEALQQARKFKPLLNIEVIFSDGDPKEIPLQEIKKMIN